MQYSGQVFGNGKAEITVEGSTKGFVFLHAFDAAGDDTTIRLRYEEVQELIEKLQLAAELVGKPPATVVELHRLFNQPSPDDDAA